jgi:hypothetical protein
VSTISNRSAVTIWILTTGLDKTKKNVARRGDVDLEAAGEYELQHRLGSDSDDENAGEDDDEVKDTQYTDRPIPDHHFHRHQSTVLDRGNGARLL